MATEIGRLIAVFDADDRRFHVTRRRVESGAKQTADRLTSTEREQRRASESLQKQRSSALIAEWKRQEREAIASARRIANEQIKESRRAAAAQLRAAKQWAGVGGSPAGGGGGLAVAAGLAGGLTALLGVSAISSIRQAGAAWFDYASKLEATRIAFTTMLGSAQAASEHLRELQQFALTTPFEFQELVEASQRMQALGFRSGEVVPILRDVGNAVAAAGGGSERLDRVVLALSQMQSKGKVMTQELNQLAEAGIPAWKIMEQQLGKSRAELVKLVEQGKISSEVFLQAFQQFSQKNFGDLMAKQSKTAIGALSNLKDAIMQISEQALQPLFDLASRGLLELSNSLITNQSSWIAWGREISTSISRGITDLTLLIQTVRDLDRELANSTGLAQLSQRAKEQIDQFEQQRTTTILAGIALINSLRSGGPSARGDDAGEFAIAGGPGEHSVGAGVGAAVRKKATALPGGGGGGGRRAQRDALADAKRSLEIGLRTLLETLKAEEDGVERSYDQRRLVVASFARAASRLEETRHEEVMKVLSAEVELAKKIKDPAERKLALEDLALRKIEEGNRHRREAWSLEDKTKGVTRERIASVETLVQRLTREREVLKQIAQERSRFAGEISRQDLGGGSFVLTPDVRGGITRPRVATTERQVEDERLQIIRDRMRQLASDLTSILDRAVYDGFEGGMIRGFQSLTLGILQLLQNVFMKRLESMLANALSDIGTSGGGGGGFFRSVLNAALSGFGLTGGFAGGASGAVGGIGSGFAGAFASGGTIPMGKWGIVHDGEQVHVGPAGAHVIPTGKRESGGTTIYNINVPVRSAGAYSSPRSRRQLAEDVAGAIQGATI